MEFKYKFKLCKPDNKIKPVQSFKVGLYTIDKCSLEGIFKRLENIEKIIGKLNTGCGKNMSESSDNNNKELEKYRKTTINLKVLKILNYDNYPSQLLSFYFIYQHFYSSPSLISIREYYECMAHFNGNVPEYLACAIMSKSSLNSPIPQLYKKNLYYCNYYYEQSVNYLNLSISKNEIDIYMLHTLYILSWIDMSLNRQFSRFSRIATSTKLAQILGLYSTYLNTEYTRFNISQYSLKKLLLFLKDENDEISKIFNLPKLNICKELEFDYHEMQNEEKDTSFIDRNSSLLPKEYYLTFKAHEYYLNLKYTHIDELERDLYKDINYSFQECFKLIQLINQKYFNLPSSIRYSKDCLNSKSILEYPLLNKIIRLYQLVLKQISVVHSLLVRIIHKSSINQISYLAQSISNFFDTVLRLLKDQQFSILKSSKNRVQLDTPFFFYYGSLSLDLMEKLNQELGNRKCSKLKRLLEITITEFDSFNSLISNLKSDWEGSDKVLKTLTERYESIKLVK
jgi:hypothetical protein